MLADPTHRIAARVKKATIDAADVDASRARDRHARGRAAAAAPVHSSRRIGGRRDAAPVAHGLPPRRAPHRRARRDGGRCRRDHLHQSSVRLALRDGARGQRTAPAPPRPSGNRRRLRPVPAPGAPALREFSGRVAPAAEGRAPAHRGDLRFRANRRRLRRRGRPHPGSRGSRCSTTGTGGCTKPRPAASRTRTPTPALSSSPSATPCAGARSTSQLFDDLLSAFRQDVLVTRYDTWPDLLDYCRRSANPVGRLVLRIAGYRDDRLDAMSDAVCRALQLTNFWQDLRA